MSNLDINNKDFWRNLYDAKHMNVNNMFTIYLINTDLYDEEVSRKVGNDLRDAEVYAERGEYENACKKLTMAFEWML